MSRPSRSRRNPALLRARYRTLFFLILALAALLLGHAGAAVPAALGALLGVWSVRVARVRSSELAHTFVALDWLLLGCTVALAGGADSWLLGAVPLLAFGQLAGAPRSEWPYLMGPALLLLIVLAIEDPTLGGNRAAAIAVVAVLAGGGWVAATRVRRRPARRPHDLRVDASTGLSTAACLPGYLDWSMSAALETHLPLGILFVRLDHYEDNRRFLGAERAEDLVRSVARRAERQTSPGGRAFRVGPDSFVLVLPGCGSADVRERAGQLARDVSANLIAGRRLTVSTGISTFPTIRDSRELLAAARDEALPAAIEMREIPTVVPLAAAQ